MTDPHAAIAAVFRIEFPRLVAGLARLTREVGAPRWNAECITDGTSASPAFAFRGRRKKGRLMMTGHAEKPDKHFPLFFNDNPVRRLFLPPRRLTRPFVKEGEVTADIGCGPGFFTLELAELVGPQGKVYAVDFDEQAIRSLERKVGERGFRNIEPHAASATDLRFIQDGSVDFVLAHGLFCSMAPEHHTPAANEIRRILKPGGLAYLSVARGPWSYVDRAEWERLLGAFRVQRRGEGFPWLAHRWAVVSTRQR